MVTKLKRSINRIPSDIKQALGESNLWVAYHQRPSYQRNDYIGWITRAKLLATRQKRLGQMLDELKKGNVYMKMSWRPSRCGKHLPSFTRMRTRE